MEFDSVAENREGSPCLSSADGGINHIDSTPARERQRSEPGGVFFLATRCHNL